MVFERNDTSKLTCKQIDAFMKDEAGARDEYAKLGLAEMSKDEADHYKILQRAKSEKGCK